MPRLHASKAPLFVVAAGVCAALHVGKLPPAVSALQLSLGLTLVQAGFLLSLAWPLAGCTTFSLYASQWLAVVAFLPIVYEQAGVPVALRATLTATVALVNLLGNVLGGRLMHRGQRTSRLMTIGFVTMAITAVVTFADLPFTSVMRFASVVVFSRTGGPIPVALFSTAMKVAPGDDAVSTTIGWLQQWSALGQFAGPPIVAWIASRTGSWHWTWAATGTAALTGLLITAAIARRFRTGMRAHDPRAHRAPALHVTRRAAPGSRAPRPAWPAWGPGLRPSGAPWSPARHCSWRTRPWR